MNKIYKSLKTSTTYLAFILLISIGTQSCTEDFPYEVGSSDPILVIDGNIVDSVGASFVRLMLSSDYYSNKLAPAISGATVLVNDGVSTITFEENSELPGYYFPPEGYVGVVGHSYQLLVENVDIDKDGTMEVYEAEDDLKYVAPVDSASMDYFDEHTGFWRIWLHAQDPEYQEDYYVFKVYKNDSLISDRIQKWSIANDEFFNGNYASVDVYYIEEEDEDGNRPKDAPELNDEYRLEMCGVSENYFDFIMGVQWEMFPKVPLFSGPAANVPTNISNGAMGYFAAFSVSSSSFIVTQEILDQKY